MWTGVAGSHMAVLLLMSFTAEVSDTLKVNVSDICGLGDISFRVIGGSGAGTCQFPWMVMVYNHLEQTFCGGSIIDNSHILTAAHCCFNTDERTAAPRKAASTDLIVLSGSAHLTFNGITNDRLFRRTLVDVITHEGYNPDTLENDIAILRLSRPVTYDECHRPLCLPEAAARIQSTARCRTMGWGTTSNDADDAPITNQLQYVDLPVVPDSLCRIVYGHLSSDKTFCAGSAGKDACQDDSGGPLVCRQPGGQYYLYGIVSAGIDRHCGRFLGLYTKVPAYLPWIKNKTWRTQPEAH